MFEFVRALKKKFLDFIFCRHNETLVDPVITPRDRMPLIVEEEQMQVSTEDVKHYYEQKMLVWDNRYKACKEFVTDTVKEVAGKRKASALSHLIDVAESTYDSMQEKATKRARHF